jgi:nucleoside-diphosphate-sugar epimerase
VRKERIILTGGAGLVGQNLVPLLKQSGYKNLVILDKHKANLEILRKFHPDISVEYADLAEPGDWKFFFENADSVVMLQAQIGDPSPEPFVRNNIHSTDLILAAIKEYAVPYTVHISSSAVQSVANDYYTATKKIQEEHVLKSGIPCVILRPTLMYGWFDRKHFGWLSRFMQKSPIFPVPGKGNYIRQPLYVEDFCKIIVSCIKQPIIAKTFNITGLEKIHYIDIIREIKKQIDAKSYVLKIPYSLFKLLLSGWALFDKNPPFTVDQLKALVASDEFEVIDWPNIFGVKPTLFQKAVKRTFNDPIYSKVILKF